MSFKHSRVKQNASANLLIFYLRLTIHLRQVQPEVVPETGVEVNPGEEGEGDQQGLASHTNSSGQPYRYEYSPQEGRKLISGFFLQRLQVAI